MSFNEKGTIAVKHYGGKIYAEKAPKVEAKQNVRGVFEMLCAYDIHTHEVMYEFYDHKLLNGQAIELVYLPTNASWMNDVERVFADIEKNVLVNSNSPTTEHLQERISNYLEVEYPKKI